MFAREAFAISGFAVLVSTSASELSELPAEKLESIALWVQNENVKQCRMKCANMNRVHLRLSTFMNRTRHCVFTTPCFRVFARGYILYMSYLFQVN